MYKIFYNHRLGTLHILFEMKKKIKCNFIGGKKREYLAAQNNISVSSFLLLEATNICPFNRSTRSI